VRVRKVKICLRLSKTCKKVLLGRKDFVRRLFSAALLALRLFRPSTPSHPYSCCELPFELSETFNVSTYTRSGDVGGGHSARCSRVAASALTLRKPATHCAAGPPDRGDTSGKQLTSALLLCVLCCTLLTAAAAAVCWMLHCSACDSSASGFVIPLAPPPRTVHLISFRSLRWARTRRT
jgi:hypothetical protein